MTTPSELLLEVRKKKPLVHHITNYVTVNDCANICICAGGSPVMTDERKDIEEMVAMASAVVLNIGTLNERTVESMLIAGHEANKADIPVILDPVGAGATSYRTSVVGTILGKVDIAVIKGNAGEIGTLAGTGGKVRGVDSASGTDNKLDSVMTLAEKEGCVVASTGKTDFVSDGRKSAILNNGHDLLECISGTGCMVSSVVGCYVGSCGPSVDSVMSAISVFNISGELAAKMSDGPGTFKMSLMDAMYNLQPDVVGERLRIMEPRV